jgi:hypothetical protein
LARLACVLGSLCWTPCTVHCHVQDAAAWAALSCMVALAQESQRWMLTLDGSSEDSLLWEKRHLSPKAQAPCRKYLHIVLQTEHDRGSEGP